MLMNVCNEMESEDTHGTEALKTCSELVKAPVAIRVDIVARGVFWKRDGDHLDNDDDGGEQDYDDNNNNNNNNNNNSNSICKDDPHPAPTGWAVVAAA